MTLFGCQGEFLLQRLQRRGLRHRIRHIEIGRHTACCRSPTLRIDISLLRQSGLPEMHMIVDDARQHKATRSIYDLIIGCFGRMRTFYYMNDLFVFNEDGTVKRLSLIDNGASLNQYPHFCGRLSGGRCRESGTARESDTGGCATEDCGVSSTNPFCRA